MKAITIHGLEDPVWALLKERAKEQGASVNASVKGILEQALGVKRIRQQLRLRRLAARPPSGASSCRSMTIAKRFRCRPTSCP